MRNLQLRSSNYFASNYLETLKTSGLHRHMPELFSVACLCPAPLSAFLLLVAEAPLSCRTAFLPLSFTLTTKVACHQCLANHDTLFSPAAGGGSMKQVDRNGNLLRHFIFFFCPSLLPSYHRFAHLSVDSKRDKFSFLWVN